MIAATNRPDILDPALLRPGRFDRQIMVPLPTLEERIDILKVHFRDKKIADDVSIEVVARGTPGMSGADLANLVNEAALFAVRRGENAVHKEDFEDARDRVLMGLKRPTVVMNDEEKEHTAYHEAGHAIAAYVLEHADPVHKVTILPTGMALGMTQQLPEEEKYSHDKEFLDDMLSVLLGGRVAEEHRLRLAVDRRAATTSCAAPRSRGAWCGSGACRTASARWRGVRRVRCSSARTSCTRATTPTRPPASSTRRSSGSCARQEERTRDLLTKYRTGLDAVAQALLQHETLDGLEVERLVDGAVGLPRRRPAHRDARRRHRGDRRRRGSADRTGSRLTPPRLRGSARCRRAVEPGQLVGIRSLELRVPAVEVDAPDRVDVPGRL